MLSQFVPSGRGGRPLTMKPGSISICLNDLLENCLNSLSVIELLLKLPIHIEGRGPPELPDWETRMENSLRNCKKHLKSFLISAAREALP